MKPAAEIKTQAGLQRHTDAAWSLKITGIIQN